METLIVDDRQLDPFKLLLLARGRDRLETIPVADWADLGARISYSLGDAIDWKQLWLDGVHAMNISPTR